MHPLRDVTNHELLISQTHKPIKEWVFTIVETLDCGHKVHKATGGGRGYMPADARRCQCPRG